MLAKRKLSASRCVLVEDSRDNLRTAKQMGLKTVWVTQYHPTGAQYAQRFARARFIDIKIKSIKQLPTQISKLTSMSFNKTQRTHGNHGY
jgi:putative hydrolase of the HAD superfamily